jgi:hypothetical protein
MFCITFGVSMLWFETYLWISFELLSSLVLFFSEFASVYSCLIFHALSLFMFVLSSITKKGEIVSI